MGTLSEDIGFDDPTRGMPDYYTYWDDHCLKCRAPIVQPAHGRRKFCSNACKQSYHRMMNQAFKDRNRWDTEDQRGEKQLRQLEKRFGPFDDTPDPETGLSPRWRLLFRLRRGMTVPQCRWCGKPFVGGEGPGSDSVCCSAECRDTLHNFQMELDVALVKFGDAVDGRVSVRLRLNDPQRGVPVLPLRYVVGLCVHCGRPFPRYGLRRRYCSERCRKVVYHLTHRRCRRCRRWFKVSRFAASRHVYCSPYCGHAMRLGSITPDSPPLPLRRCPVCAETFQIGPRYLEKRFCSQRCKSRYHRQRNAASVAGQIVTPEPISSVIQNPVSLGLGL